MRDQPLQHLIAGRNRIRTSGAAFNLFAKSAHIKRCIDIEPLPPPNQRIEWLFDEPKRPIIAAATDCEIVAKKQRSKLTETAAASVVIGRFQIGRQLQPL